MIIDMHCHIDLYPDPKKIIAESCQHDLYVLSVTTTPKAWNVTNKMSSQNKRIKTALGFHPQIVGQRFKEIDLFDAILPNTKYVGEIGLDGSKEFSESFDQQLNIFRHILHSIKKTGGRIMSIHSKNATNIVIDELKKTAGIPVLHWFSGTKSELTQAIQNNCWFSVGLPMLFSKKGKEIINIIPRNRILTETDGPFTKYNNNTLHPWDVKIIISELSKLWNIPVLETENIIISNFNSLFIKPTSKFIDELKKDVP